MNKVYSKIFKKTQTDATQVWWMEQNNNSFTSHFGQIDGAITVSEPTTVYGKNIGKKNETSDIEQATLEIESQYKKKLAQGNYKESIEDIDTNNYFKPMLANKYKEKPVTQKMINEGVVFSEIKIDGIRCIINKLGMFSREGKPIVSCPHIYEVLKPVLEKNPDLIIDGELYNHELKDNFNKIISLTRQSKPTQDDLDKSEKVIKYYIYDFGFKDKKYTERMKEGLLAVSLYAKPFKYLEYVSYTKVTSFEHLDELYAQYLEDGYEGQMVRIDEKRYENKRTNQLLKRKEFIDDEFEIIEILEGKGNRSNMAGKINYKMPNGKTFESGIKGGVDFYKQIWSEKDEYVGGQGTVRFFNYTPEDSEGIGGKPRFPVTVALFKDKRDI